ncbi:uncharacterized protein LOC122639553 isoform X2 [Telopea speciosissima]|uniref:uncharacterized protein LOC122639553 isoform X2 n=1 Tax=Telopea speciosissima TaxID=54955 RepID=UPI001CC53810|nr:uncharacterized protein LOC122639553 isoform X2 [Telopea speciosissima]
MHVYLLQDFFLNAMKRAMPWSNQVDVLSSDSSSSDSDSETDNGHGKANPSDKNTISKPIKEDTLEAKTGRSKSNVIDFKALSEHGYRGGPSILNMRPPKEMDDKEPNWSWSTGKEKDADKDIEESYEERQRTRAALAEGERLTNVQTRKDKNLSFSQKEKRKRELGQASRGKNYVEEEKRLLRDNGVYSGFDS